MSGLKAILSEVSVTDPDLLKDNIKIDKRKTVGLFEYLFYGIFGLLKYSVYSDILPSMRVPHIYYPYDHFGGHISQSGLLLTLQRHSHLHTQLSSPARFQGARTSR